MFNLFNFIYKVRSSIKREDLKMSRYFCIYNYHSKRSFKSHLEKITIEKTNEIISDCLPKRIKKETKKEITDCVVIFLKFMSVTYDYWDYNKFKIEFDRIIKKNLEKLSNN